MYPYNIMDCTRRVERQSVFLDEWKCCLNSFVNNTFFSRLNIKNTKNVVRYNLYNNIIL